MKIRCLSISLRNYWNEYFWFPYHRFYDCILHLGAASNILTFYFCVSNQINCMAQNITVEQLTTPASYSGSPALKSGPKDRLISTFIKIEWTVSEMGT
jgi:hypothetical protein